MTDIVAVAPLRDRLEALRGDLVRQLTAADHLDAGLLAMLADSEIVLAAIERRPPSSPINTDLQIAMVET